jgi:hypothetical protein
MSDLEPKLSELNRIISEIELELGKAEYTKEELDILKLLIRRGMPLVSE